MFQNYAILDPIQHNFEKAPDLFWKIRPPTTKDEIALSRYLMGGTYIMQEGERVSLPHTTIEIALFQIATLFAGTNIPKSEQDPTPALADNASYDQVIELLVKLPTAVVLELWQAVGKAVQGWGPKIDDPKN